MNDKAPLKKRELEQLRKDAVNVRAAAQRKNVTLDDYEERWETTAARDHFDLGCWLFYYSRRVGLTTPEGLQSRIDCARRIFLADITNPGYKFFTVFDFGERQFDAIFEMGDSAEVIDGLRGLAMQDRTGLIAKAFVYFGWPLTLCTAETVVQ